MEKLRTHLREAGIRQTEFAKQLGISDTYLSQILSGLRCPSISVAVAIERETSGNVAVAEWAKPKQNGGTR